MGLYTMGVPDKLVRILQEEYSINTFVETGTYMGGTAVWAAGLFRKVITIENSRPIFEKTSAAYKHIGNIDFLYGHSKDHLKNTVQHLNKIAIFWLDAHWCGGESYGVQDECPLLEEIKIINSATINHIILIDDARLFVKPPPPPHKPEHWASISKVISQLNEVKDRYCFIADDIIGAVPASAVEYLSSYFSEASGREQSLAASLVPGKASLLSRVKRKLSL